MGGTISIRIQDETLTVRAALCPIVWRLDQEGKNAWFQLWANVDKRVTEGTTIVHGTFSKEIDFPTAFFSVFLLKAWPIGLFTFNLLEGLAKYCLFAFMIYLTRVSKNHSLTSTDVYSDCRTIIRLPHLLIEKLVLNCSEDKRLSLQEVFSQRAISVFDRRLNPTSTIKEFLCELQEELWAQLDYFRWHIFKVFIA